MKNVILIVLFLLPLFCFGQVSNLLPTSKHGGVYSWKSKITEDRGGVVYVYPETSSTILFYLGLDGGAPSYNSGVLDGRINISNGTGVFNDAGYPDCKFEFRFVEDKLIVKTVEDKKECLFGSGVGADGEYKRESSVTPEYYEIDGEKVFFKDIKKVN
jgi:hypothetical protein